MKKVIVTGAASMLGSALCRECVDNGINVIALLRTVSGRSHLLPNSPLVTVIDFTLEHLEMFDDRRAGGADVFYHFAWKGTARGQRDDPLIQNLNIGWTLDAVRLAARLGCKRFIGVGSQAEYGRKQGMIAPDTAVAPELAYGTAKYAAGNLSRTLSQKLGLNGIWARVFSTYGPGDMSAAMIPYCIHELLAGRKPLLTACEQQWDYLFSKDAARAFYALGKSGRSGTVYNIGSGKTRPLADYVYDIRDAVNPELSVGIGKKPYEDRQVMYLCANIQSLTEDTGFIPLYSFRDGISQTVDFMRNSKWCGRLPDQLPV